MMKRLLPFLSVLIVAIVVFAFVSRTEQGATIRADVRKRMGQAIDGVQQAEDEVQTIVEDAAATI